MTPILGITASSITSSTLGSFESIASTTVGSGGTSTVDFTSISATYTHLQIRGIVKLTSGSPTGYTMLRFNSDTASNYANHLLWGDGSSAQSYGAGDAIFIDWPFGFHSTSQFASFVIDILDYGNTNKFKTVRSLNGADQNGSGEVRLSSGLWRSTSAITAINIFASAQNLAQYSHFALYGIKG